MIITKRKFTQKLKDKVFIKNLSSAVFIYPTDTIYGIGCNALNSKAIQKIRRIKQRTKQPFSVIAPSKRWIYKNCMINKQNKKQLLRLPGPYTLIFKLKNTKAIAKAVTNLDSVGVRIPSHWFSRVVSKLKFPIITTSVNISGKKHMTSLKDLNKSIKRKVDFIIYEGQKKGRPSTVIDCTKEKSMILRK